MTTAASVKPKEFVVKLTNPVACNAVPPPPTALKIADAQAYILANGVKADTDAMGDALTDTPAHIRKIEIDPSVSTINVAVTQDAKDAHTADFIGQPEGPALLQGCSCCRFRSGTAAGGGAGRHLRYLHAYSCCWNHRRIRTNRPHGRIPAAGEEGWRGAPHCSEAFTGAPRAVNLLAGFPPGDRRPCITKLLGLKGSPLRRPALFVGVPGGDIGLRCARPSSKGLLHAMAIPRASPSGSPRRAPLLDHRSRPRRTSLDFLSPPRTCPA